ncbi:MAG: hypothetical protein IJZ23_05255 [Roseburia sp.]|nr:hypothetical protein [Roseburia sp.]
MKNKKKFFSVLMLSIALCGMCIIGCGGDGDGDVIAQGGDTEVVSTQGIGNTESSTENITEDVVGTEEIESTEETETTEMELPDEAESSLLEEEEILQVTPTDDSVNNGSGSNEKETYIAPEVASVDNPIIKVATGAVPVEFSTGNIPAGKTWYYKVTSTKGRYMCIEDTDAAIIYGGKTYQANDEGKVLFKIEESTSVVAIKNTAKAANNFKVSIIEIEKLVGTKDNPEVITTIATEKADAVAIENSLEAGDEDGYYYTWTATHDAIVDFTVSAASASDLAYDIIITVNDVVTKMSENGLSNDDGTTMTTSVSVAKGDAVSIQIIAIKAADGSYPAVEKVSFTPRCIPSGYEENPIVLQLEQVPGSIDVTVLAGETVYYTSGIIGGAKLSIADETANVIYQGQTYTATEGIVSLEFAESTNREPIGFAVSNTGTADKTYTLVFDKEYPEGSVDNPLEIDAGADVKSRDFAEGEEGYYYKWTALTDGTVTFDISATVDVGWQYSISSDSEENPIAVAYYSDAEEPVLNGSYTVRAGDVIIIKVGTYEADASTTPAGKISFTLTFAENVEE